MIQTTIIGERGVNSTKGSAHVHPFKTANGNHFGLVTLTHPFLNLNPEFHPFLNPTFGTAMNKNVSFGGTPELIFNGILQGWVGSIIAGAWDFADTSKVVITQANNNDEAIWDDSYSGQIDMTDFTALTGKVDLDVYNEVSNSIIVQFGLAGVDVGNSVNLNDVIDTGNLSEQNFAIPKASFGLSTQTIDEMSITILRTGGAKPTIKFDEFQLEETGDPLTYKATTPKGTRFHITEIRIRITDDLDSTLSNSSMPNINYDNILGVTALTNGIVFSRVQDGKTLFSATLKNLDDFFATGSNLIGVTGNASKLGLTLLVEFPDAIILKGDDGANFLSFTVNDDLSGLTRLTAAARGSVEV